MVSTIKLDGWEGLVDSSFVNSTASPGIDQELFTLQIVFMSTVLDLVLLNPKGMNLVHSYKDNPRTLWDAHESHQTSSNLSQKIEVLLSDKLTNMKSTSSKSQTDFLEEFDTVL